MPFQASIQRKKQYYNIFPVLQDLVDEQTNKRVFRIPNWYLQPKTKQITIDSYPSLVKRPDVKQESL